VQNSRQNLQNANESKMKLCCQRGNW